MAFSLVDLTEDDPRAVLITAMISDLGWCLSSFGRIEYLFGDLVWHARGMPEYVEAAGKQFPMSLGGRLRTLSSMLKLTGRLDPYREELELLVGRLNELEGPRHMFVHGHTSFASTPAGDAAMIFRTFLEPPKGGGKPASKYEGQVRPASLAHAKFVWTLFSGTAQETFRRIYMELGLEEL